MKCDEFQDRLQLFLDGELPIHEETELHSHAKQCLPCGEWLSAAHRLTDGLRLQPLYLPPPGFADRLVARLSGERRRQVRQYQWLAMAASVLVAGFALWAGGLWLSAQSRKPAEIAQTSPKNDAVHPFLAISAKFEEVVPVTLDATKQVVEETVSTASSWVPALEHFAVQDLPIPVEAPFVPIREMTQTLAISLEPLANSAQTTWNAMWRDRRDSEKP